MKKITPFLFFVVIALLFYSCDSEENTENCGRSIFETQKTISKNDSSVYLKSCFSEYVEFIKNERGSDFAYKNKIIYDKYSVEVLTYYLNDSLSDDEAWSGKQWPIVINQLIIFKKADSIFSVFKFPTRSVWRETKKGKRVKCAEMVIWTVSVICSKKNTYFKIDQASAICVGKFCPSYEGVFNFKGEPIFQYFVDKLQHVSLITGGKGKIKIDQKDSQEFRQKLKEFYEENEIQKSEIKIAFDNHIHVGVRGSIPDLEIEE